jgi:hypothetical protein
MAGRMLSSISNISNLANSISNNEIATDEEVMAIVVCIRKTNWFAKAMKIEIADRKHKKYHVLTTNS